MSSTIDNINSENLVPEPRIDPAENSRRLQGYAPAGFASDIAGIAARRIYWRCIFKLAIYGPLPTAERDTLADVMGQLAIPYRHACGDLHGAREFLKQRTLANGLLEQRQRLWALQRRRRAARSAGIPLVDSLGSEMEIGRQQYAVDKGAAAQSAADAYRGCQRGFGVDVSAIVAELESGARV